MLGGARCPRRGGNQRRPALQFKTGSRATGFRFCEQEQSLLAAVWRADYFPAMIEAVEIERMSITEKLQAMELLWRSMSREPEKQETPAWHEKILAQRLAKVEAG